MGYFDPAYLENVYAALFAQLQKATFPAGLQVRTWQRSMRVPDEVPPADQPAIIQWEGHVQAEQREQRLFGPTKWIFAAMLLIYVRADSTALDQSPLPATTVNYLIWGLRGALETTPPYQRQTLGGLVVHCWMEGAMSIEATREQMCIMVPILMDAGPIDN